MPKDVKRDLFVEIMLFYYLVFKITFCVCVYTYICGCAHIIGAYFLAHMWSSENNLWKSAPSVTM